jgi:RNA polymerase sigma-70 factor (ECF subfamily)
METLLMRAQEVAWRFSLTVCGHADDAEDAMQEALIRTYRHVAQVRDPEAFRPWLYRTVRNACLMSRRRKVHEPAVLESLDQPARPLAIDPADPGRSPEQMAENTRLRRRLRTALQSLPAPYRVIVFLREMEGLSTREVAAVLGISEDNVKTRLHRARVALQGALQQVKG